MIKIRFSAGKNGNLSNKAQRLLKQNSHAKLAYDEREVSTEILPTNSFNWNKSF